MVSEEGGIVNFAVDSEFIEGPIEMENTLRRKKLRTNNFKKKKNFLDKDTSIISGKLSPESRYLTTAGTINMSKGAAP